MRKLLLIVLLSSPIHAQEHLGTIVFPNSGKPEAQAAFLRGVLLLHNFAYPQAEKAFVEAQKIDPKFALAYWGQAMTYNHPLWNQVDVEAGRRVLQNLRPLAASATPRERGYFEAIEALYGPGDKNARNYAYEAAMERLARAYPKDVEAQVFWALTIDSREWHQLDERRSVRAAAILEELFPTHEDHPGVLHYLIHAYDDPVHAPLGLRAARRYANVASSAPHALHMPSHIFLQLGMWDETSKSNEAAYALSKEWSSLTCTVSAGCSTRICSSIDMPTRSG
jgi:tetratricopeptide (TPR) repeat protein